MCCCGISVSFYFFFFQAEDGIRDKLVTGVQTCALPISGRTLALGRVGGRPGGTRAAHPPRRRVLGPHETARSPGARRRRAAPAPDDRGRKPVRRRDRENAACGPDRELLRRAWPRARRPGARLWRA